MCFFVDIREDDLNRMGRIALIADNSAEYIRTLILIWEHNNIPVLIDHRLPCSTCLEMMKAAGVMEVFTDRDDIAEIIHKNDYEIQTHRLAKNVGKVEMSDRIDYRFSQSEEEAVVLFSSGSTGRSKGIKLSFSAILKSAGRLNKIKGITSDSKIYIYRGMAHCAPFIGELVGGIVSNCRIYVSSTRNMMRVHLNNMKELGITHLSANPSVIQMMLRDNLGEGTYKQLQSITCSGAMLPEKVKENAMDRFGVDIINMYGMTETSSVVTFQVGSKMEHRTNVKGECVGKEIEGAKVDIIDPISLDMFGEEKVGEVIVKTDTLMLGYLGIGLPEERMIGGYWRTGDAGCKDSEGRLYIVGRMDRMIITAGNNVFPEHIEKIIGNVDGVEDCIVRGEADDVYGQRIICEYVAEKNVEEAIYKICEENLSRFERPYKYIKVSGITRTPSGKVSCQEK